MLECNFFFNLLGHWTNDDVILSNEIAKKERKQKKNKWN